MKKKSKKNKKKERTKKGESDKFSKFSKLDALTKIDELNNLAQSCKINGDFEKAINIGEKIIRLAIRFDLPTQLKEQEKFINSMAEIIQKNHEYNEFVLIIKALDNYYEELIADGQIEESHRLIGDFVEKYEDNSSIMTLPFVQDLVIKERKFWINYAVSDK